MDHAYELAQTRRADRRVERTHRALREALLELMAEKGYEAVTVQDIIDRADVGRSTFYAHYYDKEQLLLGNIAWLRRTLEEQRESHAANRETGTFRFGFSCAMLRHVRDNVRLYRATVGRDNGSIVLHHVKRMLSELAAEDMAGRSDTWRLPESVILSFVVNTYIALLQWWIEQDTALTAEEIDEQFHELAFRGIDGLRPEEAGLQR